jgi:4'-phosphopantetheinyl transferase
VTGDAEPGPETVSVWRASLAADDAALARFGATLSAPEQERAARFAYPRERNAFVASRGLLRALLPRYAGGTPAALAIEADPLGKPRLVGPCGIGRFRFSVAHSGGLWACAVALGREVGLDVEEIRPSRERDSIAERYYSPAERAALASLPEGARERAFHLCWTRKEAWLKARGLGLTVPLDSFDVSVHEGEPARLLATRPDAAEAARWTLVDLDFGPTFAGALAVEGSAPDVRMREFAV